jgi:hypothetical protein
MSVAATGTLAMGIQVLAWLIHIRSEHRFLVRFFSPVIIIQLGLWSICALAVGAWLGIGFAVILTLAVLKFYQQQLDLIKQRGSKNSSPTKLDNSTVESLSVLNGFLLFSNALPCVVFLIFEVSSRK